jgi:hypothetical protein
MTSESRTTQTSGRGRISAKRIEISSGMENDSESAIAIETNFGTGPVGVVEDFEVEICCKFDGRKRKSSKKRDDKWSLRIVLLEGEFLGGQIEIMDKEFGIDDKEVECEEILLNHQGPVFTFCGLSSKIDEFIEDCETTRFGIDGIIVNLTLIRIIKRLL